MIRDGTQSLNDHIARRVRELRAARKLSLDALAIHCGVSRSMISLIERGESSPTAVLLERLATGLDVPLASLFDVPRPVEHPISRLVDQVTWRDPQSGYVRRNVSPHGVRSPLSIVDVNFPPQARVAYETSGRESRIDQQVWVLEGCMEITVGAACHRLEAGDCLAMVLDQPIVFHNPSNRAARYAVVLAADVNQGG